MLQQQISDEQTFNISHYNSGYYTTNDHGTSHLSVIAPDGQTVSATVYVRTFHYYAHIAAWCVHSVVCELSKADSTRQYTY